MRRLLPPAGTTDPDLDTPRGLAAAYAYPAPREKDRPYLRANMVASLDGAAHAEGRSAPLSSPADMRIFGTLRALADAVLVGAETVRREGYRPAKARKDFAEQRAAAGQLPAPVIAVVSRSLDLDLDAPLFREPATPAAATIVLTCTAAPRERRAAAEAAGARVVLAGDTGVDPVRAVAEMAALGHTRLLHEGGPRLLAQFAAAGVLDELCLTVAPLLVGGDAPRVMNGLPMPAGPAPYVPLSVLEEGGQLFTRYVRG
ncbi:pyrimidine reductase family protein [Actinacidiphila bryophytorum]|jgi:5-amino-6-(5-phosphoribosylamino)uracil reductase|uniref:pyrimidine reductase family protein n=1 Tax=Actinacidiphila bryophytorum TaxID=1436133 RepID=UPI002176A8C9|nr:pyrimidine reductase family protein [Actinacidiphila bryophytorum]UWE11660.1 pyrimidine reductase family protein [Actinacidiphila bryophytorum]